MRSSEIHSENNEEERQSLLTAGIWQTSGNLISGLLTWLLILILSREDIGLGAEAVGILNTGTALYASVSLFMVGIRKSTSQKVAENIHDEYLAIQYARNGAFSIFTVSIICSVGLLISSFYFGQPLSFQDELSSILFIIGLCMFINWFREASQIVMAGIGSYKNISKAYMIFFIFQFLLGILIIFIIKGLNLPPSFIFLAYACGIIAQTLILNKYFQQFKPFNTEIFRFKKVDRQIISRYRNGFFFAITEIIPFGFLGSISLIILLAFTNSFEITGAYSIVVGYAFAGLMVTNFAWPLITSVAEAYGRGDIEQINHYLRLIAKIFFYITFLILIIMIGLAYGIISLFYGDLYLTGSTDIWIPFILLTCGYAITGFEYLLCGIILGIGKGRAAAIYLGSTFLTSVGISIIFLLLNIFSPQINASLGFFIGSLVMLPFLPYLMKKYIKQSIPFSIGLRSFLAFILTLIIAIFLVIPPLDLIPLSNFLYLVLAGALLVFLYLIFLVFFGSISQDDFILLEKKAEEYKIKKYIEFIMNFFKKLMHISPFSK